MTSRTLAIGLVPLVIALTASGKSAAFPPSPPTEPTILTAGTLQPLPAMSIARMAHTATRLTDGRVLVAGGFVGEESAARSAEMYAPRSRQFSALPRMRMPRHSHTATLLPNGKVLLTGGYGAGNATTTSAELYDPVSNTFTSTGSMRTARAGHVASQLANGKVLIAGGVGAGWSFLASAEIYDPATGAFTTSGDMTVARESHVAVRLRDDRILIVGGHRDRRANMTIYASSEVFDPKSGTFQRVGDMRVRRHKHDAVLLADGRVLVTAGSDERDSDGAYTSSEIFDPRTNTFSEGPVTKRPRYKHQGSSVLLPSGTVLIAGGDAQAESYDPVTRTFSLVPGDTSLGGLFSAVALAGDGTVVITGGYGRNSGPRASAWVYQP
ncbi:MAG: hypothetical protein IT354_08140 [Gemmatimonadaceae bacterium]|nr:hypothetical protein [Gemmatimonadaceae bacterium]